MVSLILILCLAVTVFVIVKFIKGYKSKDEVKVSALGYGMISGFCAAVSLVLFIWVVYLINTVGTAHIIDEKIAMYEAENASIEEKIDVTVKNYMSFEATTYGELKNEDAINLVSLFPELKSDTLIQQQIEVYVANNQKIKELKEEKIDVSKKKFDLYFGR